MRIERGNFDFPADNIERRELLERVEIVPE